MNNNNTTMLTPFFIVLTIKTFVLLSAMPATASRPITTLNQKKIEFSHKLDSLNIVTQEQKRAGQSVAALEHTQALLRDSLGKIRKEIQLHAQQKTSFTQNKSLKAPQFIPQPKSLFDWIIVIVGIIATFSGILLITGIIRKILFPRNKTHASSSPAKETSPPEAVHKSTDRPDVMYPYTTLSSEVEGKPTETGTKTSTTPSDLATLQALKMRISSTPAHKSNPSKTSNPVPIIDDELPATSPVSPQGSRLNSDTSLEQKVIIAAQQGMDTATISKTYHISTDHVALILKMARGHKK